MSRRRRHRRWIPLRQLGCAMFKLSSRSEYGIKLWTARDLFDLGPTQYIGIRHPVGAIDTACRAKVNA
jgi:hypothetical protein